MGGALALIEQLVIDRVLSNGVPFTGKSKAGLGLVVLSGLFLLLGTGFIIWGSYLWLSYHYTRDIAALVTGLVIFCLSILMALGAYALLKFRERNFQKIKADVANSFRALLETADEELTGPLRENPKMAVLIASLSGFLAGKAGKNFLDGR